MSLKSNKLVSLLLICAILLITISAVSADEFTKQTETIIVEDVVSDVADEYDLDYSYNYDNDSKSFIVLNDYEINIIPIVKSNFTNDTSNNTGGCVFVNNSAGDNGGPLIWGGTTNIAGIAFSGNYASIINGAFTNNTHLRGGTTVKFENSNKYNINTDLEAKLPVYDQPKISAHINSSIKKLNNSVVNSNSRIYSNNSTDLNSKSIVLGFELNLSLGNYEINLDLSVEYSYSTVKNSDVNIIDSNFLNNAASNNYKVVLEDNETNYTMFDTDFLNSVICKSTTNEIINSAVTVYESNFARNSLLRIANESVIGNYRLGIVTFSYDLKSINDTITPAMDISIGHYKILSGNLSISNSYDDLNNILTVDIGNYTVKDCLMISKNKIEYKKTIDDSLVIVGNL